MSFGYLKDLAADEYVIPDPWFYLTARRYKGAVVELFAKGLHRGNIKHVDVSSMYPNIMIVFNLSPESVRLIRTKPWTGQYILTPTYIEVPDATIGKQICLEVDEADSISRRMLSDLYDRRSEVKATMTKEEKVRESGPKYAMQLTLKIIMNAVYGYNGMEWALYGSYLVAIATAAIGRFILRKVAAWLRGEGVKLIEMDTDGVYCQGTFDIDELNAYIQHLFRKFPLAHRLSLDYQEYDGMLVVAMKNYALRYKGGNIWKGSGFKGSGVPGCAEHVVDRICDALFEGRDLWETWNSVMFGMLSNAPIREFEMVTRLSKAPDEYPEGSMYRKLFDQFPKSVEWGDEIRFVKTVQGRTPLGIRPDTELLVDIDFNYYYRRMVDIVLRLLEPLAETDEDVYDFIKLLGYEIECRKLKKLPRARKCSACGVRLNMVKRYLATDICWDCRKGGVMPSE